LVLPEDLTKNWMIAWPVLALLGCFSTAVGSVAFGSSPAPPDLLHFESIRWKEDDGRNVNDVLLDRPASFAFSAIQHDQKTRNQPCKTYPGEPDWPSDEMWRLLNDLLGGALIKTVPEASICYYDWGGGAGTLCQGLTDSWPNSTMR